MTRTGVSDALFAVAAVLFGIGIGLLVWSVLQILVLA